MRNDYNGIAKYYDRLSRIVFQRSVIKAQAYLLAFIKDNDRILLAGGGTGWILEEISKLNKKNVSVVYVEKSANMIALSKKRKCGNMAVEFVNCPIETYTTQEHFDVILTPFFFDNFIDKKIKYIFSKLDTYLKRKGFWLYADFVNDKQNKKEWQQMLLKGMYLFFKITTNIETQKLVDLNRYFADKYVMITQQFYYKRFIQAVAYRKIR
ncbi:class I SAM-dependent methyltransferase [Parafilimonas sp.]|uniref:class I SAM-dependent methyltransferase n=1 Tax=Parafilimonas sp. TaxID=1969739 RepID=UPI0039E24D51